MAKGQSQSQSWTSQSPNLDEKQGIPHKKALDGGVHDFLEDLAVRTFVGWALGVRRLRTIAYMRIFNLKQF